MGRQLPIREGESPFLDVVSAARKSSREGEARDFDGVSAVRRSPRTGETVFLLLAKPRPRGPNAAKVGSAARLTPQPPTLGVPGLTKLPSLLGLPSFSSDAGRFGLATSSTFVSRSSFISNATRSSFSTFVVRSNLFSRARLPICASVACKGCPIRLSTFARRPSLISRAQCADLANESTHSRSSTITGRSSLVSHASLADHAREGSFVRWAATSRKSVVPIEPASFGLSSVLTDGQARPLGRHQRQHRGR